MSLPFYARLKAWKQARQSTRQVGVDTLRQEASTPRPQVDARVYAAGIACAAQTGERNR